MFIPASECDPDNRGEQERGESHSTPEISTHSPIKNSQRAMENFKRSKHIFLKTMERLFLVLARSAVQVCPEMR